MEAEPLLRRELQCWEQYEGPDGGMAARVADKLAQFYIKQGDSQMARPLFRQALEILHRQFPTGEFPSKMCLVNGASFT